MGDDFGIGIFMGSILGAVIIMLIFALVSTFGNIGIIKTDVLDEVCKVIAGDDYIYESYQFGTDTKFKCVIEDKEEIDNSLIEIHKKSRTLIINQVCGKEELGIDCIKREIRKEVK